MTGPTDPSRVELDNHTRDLIAFAQGLVGTARNGRDELMRETGQDPIANLKKAKLMKIYGHLLDLDEWTEDDLALLSAIPLLLILKDTIKETITND